MTDEEIIDALRVAARGMKATALAALIEQLSPEGLTQGTMTMYFFRAFPQIPLRTLHEAAGWHRLTSGTLSDQDFDALLGQWLPTGEG